MRGLQNRPRRAVGVTQYRLHRSLLRLYSAQLSQMNVAVRAGEGIHEKEMSPLQKQQMISHLDRGLKMLRRTLFGANTRAVRCRDHIPPTMLECVWCNGGMLLRRQSRSIPKRTYHSATLYAKNPTHANTHTLAWNRTWASALTGQQLTASVMARKALLFARNRIKTCLRTAHHLVRIRRLPWAVTWRDGKDTTRLNITSLLFLH